MTLRIETFRVGAIGNNVYLVCGDEPEAALIDASGDPSARFPRFADVVAKRAEALRKRVAAVLLTHGHWDHIVDAAEWKRRGAKLYCSRADEEMLTGEKSLAPYFRQSVEPTEADVFVADGDEITVGGLSFSVIATPGHSPGSVCYRTDGALFTGDTLFHGDFGRFDLPGGNFKALKKSLARLFALDGDAVVYPGHEETTTLSEERARNAILSYSEEF